jgi:hypothetical protein
MSRLLVAIDCPKNQRGRYGLLKQATQLLYGNSNNLGDIQTLRSATSRKEARKPHYGHFVVKLTADRTCSAFEASLLTRTRHVPWHNKNTRSE